VELPEIHNNYRLSAFPGLSPEMFLAKVCNESLPLPELECPGNLVHLPATWMGGVGSSIPIDDEDYADFINQRQGCKTGMPVMVITEKPSYEDIECGVALSPASEAGTFMRNELEAAGINLNDVIVTHGARFALPAHLKSLKPQHLKVNSTYMLADIQACKPKVIIVCGAKMLSHLFGDKTKLDTVRGDILDLDLSKHFENGHKCKVIATVSHLGFMSGYSDIAVFRSELKRAVGVLNDVVIEKPKVEEYLVLDTADAVEALCDRLIQEKPKRIVFDTEFGNDVAREEYRYTLSVQLAWGKGRAAFIKLRDQVEQAPYDVEVPYGKPNKDGVRKTKTKTIHPENKCGVKFLSDADERRIWIALTKLFLTKEIQIGGQHMRVDVEEFARNGASIDRRIADGFDIMLVHYLLHGDDSHGLDHLVREYLPEVGAYWRELEEWLSGNGRKARLQFGYRDVPLPILIPYGLRDADYSWQVAELLEKELDRFPKLKHLYYNTTAWASLHLLDVERHGLLIDDERRMELREEYYPVYCELLDKLRKAINWPTFEPTAKGDMAYLLFNRHVYKDRDKAKAKCPEGAVLFDCEPLYNTDKYPKAWELVVADGQEAYSTPSTEVDAIIALTHEHPDNSSLVLLRHISVLGKMLSSCLKPITLNDFGVPVDGNGFAENIRNDGRVTSHFSQLTATGRYTSKKTNLQTWVKKQEAAVFEALVYHKFGLPIKEYERRAFNGDPDKGLPRYEGPDRIEVDDQIHQTKFKSCVTAPEGYVLIEVDFKNAEIRSWAFCSGDTNLIKVISQNRDIHSEVAAVNFKLPEAEDLPRLLKQLDEGKKDEYKKWVEAFKKNHDSLRVVAKAVLFGLIYGRGPAALAREIGAQGVATTKDECQLLINYIAKMYPVAWKWLQGNADFAVEHEYLENAFGARRYFPGIRKLSAKHQAAVRREAMNSNLQGLVAYLLAQAGKNFYRFKYMTDAGKNIDFKVILPIHDAFLIECKIEDVEKCKAVIKLCMSTANKIPGTDHYLDVDIEVAKRWSEKEDKKAA